MIRVLLRRRISIRIPRPGPLLPPWWRSESSATIDLLVGTPRWPPFAGLDGFDSAGARGWSCMPPHASLI
jgi:hypothetical protein